MHLLPPFADAFEESLAIQGAASARGFDWKDVDGVLGKVEEEVQEIREALAHDDAEHARRELGDLLLITVNLSRFLKANPAQALHAATQRFQRRVQALERTLEAAGKRVEECTLEELDAVWNQVKAATAPVEESALDTGSNHESNSLFCRGGTDSEISGI